MTELQVRPRPVAIRQALLALTSLLTCNAIAPAEEPVPIAWRTDLGRAQVEARDRNLPLWIQFTGPWCINCRRMDRETFLDRRVIEHAHHDFVPIKLRSDEHESLAATLGLTSLPASVIVRPSGEVIVSHEGYAEACDFDEFLVAALARDHRTPASNRAATAQVAMVEAGDYPMAMAGQCPVTLVRGHRLVPGALGLEARHDGRTYRFASAEARESFRVAPEAYAPVNDGRCPVNQVDRGENLAGDPRWGLLYSGHLYLCADQAVRSAFLKNPERYARVDVADRGFCPHCWTKDGLVVRGQPHFATTRAGLRYWSPDPTHRDAFLARASAPADQLRR